jgi:PAS domain S-box-containing protein
MFDSRGGAENGDRHEGHATEAAFRLRLSPFREYEFVAPAIKTLLGYTPEEFRADPGLLAELVTADDRHAFNSVDLAAAEPGTSLTVRLHHRDGQQVPVEVSYWPVREGGRVVALDGLIRDVSKAWRTAGALQRANRMLSDGFDGVATVDLGSGHFATMDAKAMALIGVDRKEAVATLTLGDVFDETIADRLATTGSMIADGELDRSSIPAALRRCDRTERPVMIRLGVTDAMPPALLLVFEDLSSERHLAAERKRFQQAVSAATDAIVLIDSSTSFIYANKAFCRLSGYSASECTGFRPDILRGLLPEKEMWAALGDGQPWHGIVDGAGKGDRPVQMMASASPVPGADDGVGSSVVVLHEITGEHAALAALGRERAARARLTNALATIDETAPMERVAATMCQAVVALPEVAGALLLDMTVPREPRVLAMAPDHGLDELPRYLTSRAKIESLIDKMAGGGWVEESAFLGIRLGEAMSAIAGPPLLVLSPVRHGHDTIGLLATVGSAELHGQVRSLDDLASAAAGLLAPGLGERLEQRRIRRELLAVMAARSFRPIFQPIIRLSDVSTVGWEATTRFEDGKSPTVRFAEALRVGMTIDLEVAATRLAVTEVGLNNPPGWLSLNVSTAFLGSGDRLLQLLPKDRPVVLELATTCGAGETCEALAHLPEGVRVAVDSSSSEMHTLHGIVSLRPAFVKLPPDVIRGIDGDPVRQALIAGLEHFARNTGSDLIAVGVETEAELSTLIDLGVTYGQGNYLGEPGFFPMAGATEPAGVR